jgi:thiosulfate dehydrogenase
MRKFIVGLVIGFFLVPVGLYLYCRSGRFPIEATSSPLPLERFFAMTAIRSAAKKYMPQTAPIPADAATFEAGAEVYRHNCGGCHGMINGPESRVAKGMSPHPPQLLVASDMVTDDPPGLTYWKVENGIRLSGMPSFGSSLTAQQIWQVSLMLANADRLPPNAIQTLTFTPMGAPPGPAAKPQTEQPAPANPPAAGEKAQPKAPAKTAKPQ